MARSQEVHDVCRMFVREKECRRETGSPRGKREVQEEDRKCRRDTGNAEGRQEVQEGHRKSKRETRSAAGRQEVGQIGRDLLRGQEVFQNQTV